MTNEQIMTVVKPAICAKLKSPASAQFPVDMISITGSDETGYHVAGFVDSQNSYGAMIRNDFTADVSIINAVPVVTSSTLAVQADKTRAKSFVSNYIAISIITGVLALISYFVMKLIIGF